METIQINSGRIINDFVSILHKKYPDKRQSDLTRKVIKAHKDGMSKEMKEAKALGKKERKRLKDYDLRGYRKKI